MCVIHLLWSHKANRTARKLISMDNCSLFELSRGLTLTVKAEVSCCPPVDNWKCCLLAVCWYTTSCPQFFKLHCKLFKTGTPKWHTRWCLHLFFKLLTLKMIKYHHVYHDYRKSMWQDGRYVAVLYRDKALKSCSRYYATIPVIVQ